MGNSERSDRCNGNNRMPPDGLQELLTFLLPFAQMMLEQHGSFLPFGTGVSRDGSMTLTPSRTEQALPHPSSVLAALFTDLARQASSGTIKAAGICTAVHVTLPGARHPSDAICLALEDRSGEAVEVFVPYTRRSGARPVFGDALITRIEPSIFVVRGD